MSICFLVVCGWKVIHRTPQDSWVRTLAFPSLYECAGHGLATMMERPLVQRRTSGGNGAVEFFRPRLVVGSIVRCRSGSG